MSSINKVILIGHLGKDPEIKTFTGGGRVANLSLATSESWKDRNSGERRDRTEWHTVVISNDGLVTVAERWLKKGSKIYVEGQLRTRKWQDRDGRDRYTTEVTIAPYRGELKMLDPRERGQAGGGSAAASGSGQGGAPYSMASQSYGDPLDDDVPF